MTKSLFDLRAAFLILALLLVCFLGQAFERFTGFSYEQRIALFPQMQWGILIGISIWFATLVSLTFNYEDLLLAIVFLIVLMVSFFSQTTSPITDAYVLLFCITLGRGAKLGLKDDRSIQMFLSGTIAFLALSSFWQLDATNNFYQGPRWMGLWNNPNRFGMLMGAGIALAAGMLAERRKEEWQRNRGRFGFLLTAMVAMAVGLLFSYSRGAWLAATIGLFYLAWTYGKITWRLLLPGVTLALMLVFIFWRATGDDTQWYFKRLDLSRPSAQNRVAAWIGACQMMRDHPFGVGYNNAIKLYDQNYSPPENGAGALNTNDYLMFGTQLGIPALLCLGGYFVVVCLGGGRPVCDAKRKNKVACRAGALVLIVAFWFDGGLFRLPTAALFWMLLELGAPRHEGESGKPTKVRTAINRLKELSPKQKRWSKGMLLTLGVFLLIPPVQVLVARFIDPPSTAPMSARWLAGRFGSAYVANQYHWVSITNIPDSFLAEVWMMEDHHFFAHWGFDWRQIQIAREEAKAGGKPPRGASTITQQCARSLFLWQGRSWIRKGMEAYYTVWMEAFLSKKRILELYVNVIELGDGVYGVEAAAQKYYGVPASQLTREQAAMLVAIMPNPKQWNPLQPNERALKRKELVLQRSEFAQLPAGILP